MNKERIAILQMLLCGLLWSLSGLLVKLLPWNAMVIAGAQLAYGRRHRPVYAHAQ